MAFDTGRAELKAVASRTLLKIVQLLQLNPARVVRVEGYSDSLGNKAMNMQLSQQRAQAVADALVDLGIRRERVEVVGYGEAYPLSENASARGRAQNRRVEVVFSDERGRLPPARP
jgi:outer membrane protein OmpA-like peptidoglycan-associated protein